MVLGEVRELYMGGLFYFQNQEINAISFENCQHREIGFCEPWDLPLTLCLVQKGTTNINWPIQYFPEKNYSSHKHHASILF